jgi:hypothetical protein
MKFTDILFTNFSQRMFIMMENSAKDQQKSDFGKNIVNF